LKTQVKLVNFTRPHAITYTKMRSHAFCLFVVLVDLSSMIDPHLSEIMLKYHVITTQEYTELQGESKKTDTFVIHLNIKCISFF
jgi:hypothetical protein